MQYWWFSRIKLKFCGTELCDAAAVAGRPPALDMHAVVRGKWEQDTSNKNQPYFHLISQQFPQCLLSCVGIRGFDVHCFSLFILGHHLITFACLSRAA